MTAEGMLSHEEVERAIIERTGHGHKGSLRDLLADALGYCPDQVSVVDLDFVLKYHEQHLDEEPPAAPLSRENWSGLAPQESGWIETGGHRKLNVYEFMSYAKFCNSALASDPLVCNSHLPLDTEDLQKFLDAFKDGFILTALVNLVASEKINTKSLMKLKPKARTQPLYAYQTLNTAIDACRELPGVQVVNIGAVDFVNGNTNMVLGLVWQLVKLRLLENISLHKHPEIVRLLGDGENLQEFYSRPKEDILMMWVNWHLAAADSELRIYNFTSDLQDCTVYNVLLQNLDKEHTTQALEPDLKRRAEHVIQNVTDGMGIPEILTTSRDIVNKVGRMNIALLAQIFNHNSGLEFLTREELDVLVAAAHDAGADLMRLDLELYLAHGGPLSPSKSTKRLQESPPPFTEEIAPEPQPVPAAPQKIDQLVDDDEVDPYNDDIGYYMCYVCSLPDSLFFWRK